MTTLTGKTLPLPSGLIVHAYSLDGPAPERGFATASVKRLSFQAASIGFSVSTLALILLMIGFSQL